MTRHARALTAAFALVAATGCSQSLAEVQVKDVSVSIPDVELAGVPGAPTVGDVEFDLSVELPDWLDATIELKTLRVAWTDPANHPDFSQFTSATLTAIPSPESGLQQQVIARYVQDPTDPNPDEIVIAGIPGVNLADYLSGAVLTLRIEVQGSLPSYAWTSTATIGAEMSLRAEVEMPTS